jgi:MYXO-CTERM domain-containing protein
VSEPAGTPLASPDQGPGASPFLVGGAVVLAVAAIAVVARRRATRIERVEGGSAPI